MATLKYFAQKSEDGYPIPSTMMGFKVAPLAGTLVEIEPKDYTAAEGQSVAKPASGFRYFVRRKPNGAIIPNSLITSLKKPKGLVYEFKVIEGTATPPAPPEPTGPTYWAGNLYRNNCDASLTTGTPLQVTDGTTIQVGKYYKVETDVWLITGTGQPDGMAITINNAVAYDTCAEALA